MFGYKFFQNSGDENFNTPKEFQIKARQDIEKHIQQIKPDDSRFNKLKKYNKNALPNASTSLFKHNNKTSNSNNNSVLQQQIRAQQSHLTHGSSPLRKTVTVSSNDSLSDTSSISSDHSGHSINNSNMTILSNNNLSRLNSSSTFESSIFTNQLSAIYTNTTVPSSIPTTFLNNNNFNNNEHIQISLNDALPKDFTDYYSPDLDVPRFSNNRPTFTRRNLKNWEINDIRSLLILPCPKQEWNNCIPEIVSPYPNLNFQIQILPIESGDGQYVECLANSDIYKESKFDHAFKYNTACYIVQQARIRHKTSLISTYGIKDDVFNEFNLLGNFQYDCFDKTEWRNVIENYLLNLGIENQCRIEFKTRINKLEKLNKTNGRRQSDDLYKKVLIKDRFEVNNELKQKIWVDVQKFVYENIEV